MKQALLLFLTVCCVGGILVIWLFSAYAATDVRALSKLAIDGPHSGSDRDKRITRATERTTELSETATKVGVAGWCVGMGALLYSLRLLRKQEMLSDENATLKADMEEKKVAEQVAASDR